MRHLRLAFDERFWVAAENLLADMPGEEDEGFHEPLALQDLIEIDEGTDLVRFFFPEMETEPDFPIAEEVEDLLRCDEELCDLESVSELPVDEEVPAPPESHFSPFELDYPEVPGVNCSACTFHRITEGSEDAVCSLCYMRKTAFAVYGECGFDSLFYV